MCVNCIHSLLHFIYFYAPLAYSSSSSETEPFLSRALQPRRRPIDDSSHRVRLPTSSYEHSDPHSDATDRIGSRGFANDSESSLSDRFAPRVVWRRTLTPKSAQLYFSRTLVEWLNTCQSPRCDYREKQRPTAAQAAKWSTGRYKTNIFIITHSRFALSDGSKLARFHRSMPTRY